MLTRKISGLNKTLLSKDTEIIELEQKLEEANRLVKYQSINQSLLFSMIKFNYEIRTNIWKLNWTKRFPFFNSDFNKLQVLLVK